MVSPESVFESSHFKQQIGISEYFPGRFTNYIFELRNSLMAFSDKTLEVVNCVNVEWTHRVGWPLKTASLQRRNGCQASYRASCREKNKGARLNRKSWIWMCEIYRTSMFNDFGTCTRRFCSIDI